MTLARVGTNPNSRAASPSPLSRRETVRRRIVYYVPMCSWVANYSLPLFLGDLGGGISTVCVIIPIALSYASNLAKIPPIYGLYGAAIGPAVYAVLGSCGQMNVGPESALSLLIGETIRSQLGRRHSEADSILITGIVTFMAGALVFIAGILRLGFLDSVLSRALLRGFISAVAVVIFFDQSITALGLNGLAEHTGVVHFSPIAKAWFVITNLGSTHRLTALLSLGTVLTLSVTRYSKTRLSRRYKWTLGIPDILLVVVITSVLTKAFRWDTEGVAILGHISTKPVVPKFPIRSSNYVRASVSTALLVSILGFFETVVAGKTLGTQFNYTVSANREMIALGVANVANSFFGALPVFASYSRSKINISSGGRTQMSGLICAIVVVLAMVFLMPAFYYLPKAVLSSIIAVVMYTLLQEAPHDIKFFWKVRGYADLSLMALVFVFTLVVSLEFGISVGVAISLLRVIKHSQSPRIQVLGRVPGTKEYVPVDENAEEVEHIDGFLLVRIPEPLIFANTGQLKDRLRRLELYGNTRVHPSEPPRRSAEHNARIIFDCNGMSGIDAAAAQIFAEIVSEYVNRGVSVYFVRVNRKNKRLWALFQDSGIVALVQGEGHFGESISDVLENYTRPGAVISRETV
ncbi:Putative uncharacterized protein [Taphrina deformans PYCC 5710]|uniref:STAS domain-containing protein n=1 Tax=Taphrina deformans (strain PYCC 5710 / ATCC 11124 / CBS 356.35 / IMI 108563 / JCM 9778 / NBRC 8474) TaxID=1097556 RepID=R4XAK2_TAPDE|nr:Putative uncharacterized protein [Taphrina deformans PYCC 5710]|eukprot:CCG82559.1 Putative uncharacterized protein [Taphrina deformans PYCC 5710]